jgi:hypothetical protein
MYNVRLRKKKHLSEHTDQTHIVPLGVGNDSAPINWLVTPMVAQPSDYEALRIQLKQNKLQFKKTEQNITLYNTIKPKTVVYKLLFTALCTCVFW